MHPLILMSGITSELENLDVQRTISVLSGLHMKRLIMHQIIMSLMHSSSLDKAVGR